MKTRTRLFALITLFFMLALPSQADMVGGACNWDPWKGSYGSQSSAATQAKSYGIPWQTKYINGVWKYRLCYAPTAELGFSHERIRDYLLEQGINTGGNTGGTLNGNILGWIAIDESHAFAIVLIDEMGLVEVYDDGSMYEADAETYSLLPNADQSGTGCE